MFKGRNFKEKMKGFIAGVCLTALLVSAVTVFAENIEVSRNGIKIYWDGVERTLRDVNGEKVEPMIYEGTTYVPIRGMANLMGKEVSWDQQNQAVIVGEKPVAESTSLADMKDKINKESYVTVLSNHSFTLKNKDTLCDNFMSPYRSTGYILYMLDGNYSELKGKAVYPYKEVGSSHEGSISFYSVENSGEEHEIATYKFKQTEDPIDISVNLEGVQNLKIVLNGYSSNNTAAFYDAFFIGK